MNGVKPAAIASAAALLLAVPWIWPELVWSGWLGAALALAIATTWRGPAMYGWLVYSVAVPLAIAFHWAPQTLATQMRSGYLGGLLAFLPLWALDALRAVTPFWFVGRIGVPLSAAWLPAGCCAVVCEMLLPSVFPWRCGYMLVAWPWEVQSASLLGTSALTLLVFAHAGVVVAVGEIGGRWMVRRPAAAWQLHPLAALSVAVCLLNAAYGWYAIKHWQVIAGTAPRMSVALVQAEPGFTDSLATMRQLTQRVAGQVELVCWPESSTGNYAATLRTLSDPRQVFEQSRAPNRGVRPWPAPTGSLLAGATIYEGDRDRPAAIYQAAILVDSHERIADVYRKRYLMPFGEYVPGEAWLPGLQTAFSNDEVLTRGERANVLTADGKARLGVLLCYEDMLPSAAASLTHHSANVLVSLINASDFESPLPRYQHRLLAQLRAVENRRYLLRCAATGETCVISPWGSIEKRLPLGGNGVLTAEVALLENRTSAGYGSIILPVVCAAAMVGFWLRRTSART